MKSHRLIEDAGDLAIIGAMMLVASAVIAANAVLIPAKLVLVTLAVPWSKQK